MSARPTYADALLRFWQTDRGLSALLLSLVAVIFVIPATLT